MEVYVVFMIQGNLNITIRICEEQKKVIQKEQKKKKHLCSQLHHKVYVLKNVIQSEW